MSYVSLAYQLGCKYAAEQFEKIAGAEQLVLPGLERTFGESVMHYLGKPGVQAGVAGLGGAGVGALASPEDRLRGALMGAGLGAGTVGGVHAGRHIGKLRGAGKTIRAGEEALAAGKPKSDTELAKMLEEALTKGNRYGGAIGGAAGGLGGLAMGRGVAPAPQERPWYSRLFG